MFDDDPVEDLDKLVAELRLDAQRVSADESLDDERRLHWLRARIVRSRSHILWCEHRN